MSGDLAGKSRESLRSVAFAPIWVYKDEREGVMSVLEAKRTSRTDRRWWPRATLRLPVRVVDTEGTFGVLTGSTLNISVGGLEARFDGPLPGTVATTVHVDLPVGEVLVCEALIAGGGAVGDSWVYRLAFRDLDHHEVGVLENLVRPFV